MVLVFLLWKVALSCGCILLLILKFQIGLFNSFVMHCYVNLPVGMWLILLLFVMK